MNTWLDHESAINHYYDGDFPSRAHCKYPENFDETTDSQGLRFDVSRYLEIAQDTGGPVLELCSGTGRVAMPLAEAGFEVTAVDFSAELNHQFRKKLEAEPNDLQRRIEIVEQDITTLTLPGREYPLAIVAFNSFLCLADFEEQRQALSAIAAHMTGDGLLLLDVVNPLVLPIHGDPVPKPFFTRRNPHSGNRYTRFATLGPFDASHRQELKGWYDEIDEAGLVTRRAYAVTWRPIFRYEMELMIESAGLLIDRIEGDHQGGPYTAESSRMFVHARQETIAGER